LEFPNKRHQPTAIGQISIMKLQPYIALMLVLIQMIDSSRVEGGSPTNKTMDLVALRQK
jgi:hypothetical protein